MRDLMGKWFHFIRCMIIFTISRYSAIPNLFTHVNFSAGRFAYQYLTMMTEIITFDGCVISHSYAYSSSNFAMFCWNTCKNNLKTSIPHLKLKVFNRRHFVTMKYAFALTSNKINSKANSFIIASTVIKIYISLNNFFRRSPSPCRCSPSPWSQSSAGMRSAIHSNSRRPQAGPKGLSDSFGLSPSLLVSVMLTISDSLSRNYFIIQLKLN